MKIKTFRLKNPKRIYIAGLYWYSSDAGLKKSSDKRKALQKAESSYLELSAASRDVETDGNKLDSLTVPSLLSGVVIQTTRSVSVGYGLSELIPANSYALQHLALDHSEKIWPLPTVLIRLALDDDTHWISYIYRGKLTLSSDRLVGVEESDKAFERLRKKANSQLIKGSGQLNTIDITALDQSLSELYKWEKEAKSKALSAIKPFKSLKKTSVTEHKYFRPIFWSSLGITLLIASNWGYNSYLDYQSKLAERERQERLRVLQDVGAAPRPWNEQPGIVPVYRECVDSYLNVSNYRVGWETVRWSCNAQQVTREWNRGDTGSFSILPIDEGFTVQSPNMLTDVTPLPKFRPRGSVPIVGRDQAARLLMDVARIEGYRVTFNWGNENTRRVPKGDTYITERLGHANHKVQFIGEEMPGAKMINNLAQIPSLYLVNVEQSNDRWLLTVEFYAEAKS